MKKLTINQNKVNNSGNFTENYHFDTQNQNCDDASKYIKNVLSIEEFIDKIFTYEDKITVLSNSSEKDPKSMASKLSLLCNGKRGYDIFEDIRIIKIMPQYAKSSYALSQEEHPLHTDGSFCDIPPQRFLLWVVETDQEAGGISTFLPVNRILLKMPYDLLKALFVSDFSIFRKRHQNSAKKDGYLGPILQPRVNSLPIFRWRNDEMVTPKVFRSTNYNLAVEAIDWIRQYIINTPPIYFQAKRGDLICVPNYTFLHGRTRLSKMNSSRLVYRVWLH